MYNKRPVQLLVFVVLGVLLSSILLFEDFRKPPMAQAEIRGGGETVVNTLFPGQEPYGDIAVSDDGNIVAVWQNQDTGDVYFRRFSKDQMPLDPADQILNTATSGIQSRPQVAIDKSGNFVVVWTSDPDETLECKVYIRAFQASGVAVSDEIQVNTATASCDVSGIALDYDNEAMNGSFAVVWQGTMPEDIFLRRYTVDFTQTVASPYPVDSEITVNTTPVQPHALPQVAMNTDAEIFVVWITDTVVWSQAYGTGLEILGSNFQISSSNVQAYQNARIAVDKKPRNSTDGTVRHYFITYDAVASGNSDKDIFLRKVSCSDMNAENNSDSDINCTAQPLEIRVNTITAGEQLSPAIDADYLGNFTIVWMSPDNDGNGIYAQSFRYNDGKPFGTLAPLNTGFPANTALSGNQEEPAIAMNSEGEYIIAFTDKSLFQVKFQKYIADLFKIGVETLANTPDAGVPITQSNVDVAIAPNGNKAIAWQENNDIYFSLWGSDNLPIVQKVQVDTAAVSNDQADPSISFFQDTQGAGAGRFIIAWTGSRPDCALQGEYEVWYQEVNAQGSLEYGCEFMVNSFTSGDVAKFKPDVSAGYYIHNMAVEDVFAVIWRSTNAIEDGIIEMAYHQGAVFTENFYTCMNVSQCSNPQVFMHPDSRHILYAWEDDDIDSGSGIFVQQAVEGTLIGSAYELSPANSFDQMKPGLSFLPNDQYVVTYTENNAGNLKMYGVRYQFDSRQTPSIDDNVDSRFEITQLSPMADTQAYAKIAADIATGDFFIVWMDSPFVLSDNSLYGQLYEYQGAASGSLKTFGPVFRINSTQNDSQSFPDVAMNRMGRIIVAWEGVFEDNVGQLSSGDDSAGAVFQEFLNPFYEEQYPQVDPQPEEEVPRGRTLIVPDTFYAAPAIANGADQTDIVLSIRDSRLADPVQYIELQDLDGSTAVITVSMSDFVRLQDNQVYIAATDVGVKNCDADVSSDASCIQTIQGNSDEIVLDSSTSDDNEETDVFYNFGSANTDQKILARKIRTSSGIWRIFPEFRMAIHPLTPPGNHNATLTFSLI